MAGRPRSRLAAEALGMTTSDYAKAARDRKLPSKPAPEAFPVAKPAAAKTPTPLGLDAVDVQLGLALKDVAAMGGEMNNVFEELRKEAMRFALEIMRMPLDPDERSFSKLISVKQQITTAVLTATTRVRPGDLREREDDGVARLLAALKSGEADVTEADLLD